MLRSGVHLAREVVLRQGLEHGIRRRRRIEGVEGAAQGAEGVGAHAALLRGLPLRALDALLGAALGRERGLPGLQGLVGDGGTLPARADGGNGLGVGDGRGGGDLRCRRLDRRSGRRRRCRRGLGRDGRLRIGLDVLGFGKFAHGVLDVRAGLQRGRRTAQAPPGAHPPTVAGAAGLRLRNRQGRHLLPAMRQAGAAISRTFPAGHPALDRSSSFASAIAAATSGSDGIVRLVDWLAEGGRCHPFEPRLDWLVRLLEADQALAAAVRGSFAAMVSSGDVAGLIGRAGIPGNRGFAAEATNRALLRLLPRARDPRDLRMLLAEMPLQDPALLRVLRLPVGAWGRLFPILFAPDAEAAWADVRRGTCDGLRLLAVRLAGEGLEPRRAGEAAGRIADSPFLVAARAALAIADAAESGAAADLAAWRRAELAARIELAAVHGRHGPDGVSIDTVYAMDVVERCLLRARLVVETLAAGPGPEADAARRRLLFRIAVSVVRDGSVGRLARDNLRLLHQRIIERASETGEHYVARDRAAYRMIWLQAAGGGLLTTATAAVKVAVHQLAHAVHLAPAAAGFLSGLNYAASFVALQHLHLILATKQPAMTAAALASTMRSVAGDERHERMVDETARIASSQLAAAAANVLTVAVAAAAFDAGWRLLTGRHWMDAAEAQALYLSLSPVDSLTAFYAALTGVILWLSSLIGGWFDNWVRLHHIPEGLEGRRAGWGRALRAHAAGWGTNVSLGMMLGMTPAFGEFLGLPLDVRHVTLNTGILSLALSGLERNWFADGLFIRALSGIAVMFVLNLGVSFALSLATALRAYRHPREEAGAYLRALLRRAVRRPWQFVLPTPVTAGSRGSPP